MNSTDFFSVIPWIHYKITEAWGNIYHGSRISDLGTENIAFICMLLLVGAIALIKKLKFRRHIEKHKHGSASWAKRKDIKKAGLLDDAGVILGAQQTLLTESYLTYHDNGHIAVIAPTRSGKGVGLVTPTLLTWPGSVLVVDMKGENWNITAGHRSRFSDCYRFSPTMEQSHCFNPLDCIRSGDRMIGDVQMVANSLGGLDSSSNEDTYWNDSSIAMLTLFIVHTLERSNKKSLAGVVETINNPDKEFKLVMGDMFGSDHGQLKVAARSLRNMSENQLQAIVGSTMRHLALYHDQMVADHTNRSDFQIEQLMQSDKPVSVYLSLPPPDIERTRGLFRLVISLITKRLTEEIHNPRNKQPLLVLFDEFTAFGKIDFFETALSYIAGYGIKAMMIAQSINQVQAVYGRNTSVLDQCECKVFLTPNDMVTAQTISDMLGERTIEEKRRSYSKKHESLSESSFGRPLMMPDEVMRMPFDDQLIFIKGKKPIRAKRLKYYEDDFFKSVANMKTPSIPLPSKIELTKEVSNKKPLKINPTKLPAN